MSSAIAPPPPDVETPVEGATYSSPVKFSGTGLPGWWVYFYEVPINGEDIGSAHVDGKGNWKFEAYLDPGTYRVFGLQMDNRERSDRTAIFSFVVS